MSFIGNHGTNATYIDDILKNGFRPSTGESHWCGEGVYFFIEGVNSVSIDKLAEQWSRDQSWDKKLKKNKYTTYAILESEVFCCAESLIDLRKCEDLKKINVVRDRINDFCLTSGKKMNDHEIWNFMKNKFDIKVVINNVYIQFGDERVKNIKSRINNCTIMSVLVSSILAKENIKLIRKGDI